MLPVLSFLGELAGSSCNSLDMYWLVGLSEAVGAGCIKEPAASRYKGAFLSGVSWQLRAHIVHA
ncbi:hypothetical protein F2Q68_00038624 [Brassica cretica]|uniref:Uncharacterized protein n=1 Tax=Brassica cretica TaxID=69181 RepID=A0A8S9MQR4_BRACR|nr:hypothetical protein F2Q68_00038624 [Brassica cretica]